MRTQWIVTACFMLGYIWGPALPILLTSTPLFIACMVLSGVLLGTAGHVLDKRAGRT